MAGYVRQDVGNNIENNEIADATYLDQEFDGIQAAFNSSTGHNHDGTTGEGAPITQLGPGQDFLASSSVLRAKTDATYDLGTSSFKFKDIYLSGNVVSAGGITGTFGISTGLATAPSLYVVGTPGTGIWSAGTNTLGFATSGANRMNISAAGNITMTKTLTVSEGITSATVITAASFVGNLDADDLVAGTVAVARVAGSYTGITGTGALNAGSITSGFGSINIGGDTITSGAITSSGTITGLTSFISSGTNVVLTNDGTGTVALRPKGAAVTTGQLIITNDGNVTINGTLTTTGAITGSINASNLTGTIASARLAGAYTGITQVGTLTELTVDGFFFDGSALTHASSNSAAITVLGGVSAGALTRTFGSTHVTNPNMIVNDADRHIFRTIGATPLFDLQSTGLTLGSNVGIDFAGTGAATTRTNLGLGTMALLNEGTGGSNFRNNTDSDARYLQEASNLSDLSNTVTARSNLGLGSIVTLDAGTGASNFRNNSQNDARFHNSGTDVLASGDLPTDSTATDWIQLRYATVTAGQIGTYAFLKNGSGGTISSSGTTAGSNLTYSNNLGTDSGTPGGTWRAMGNVPNGSSSLFLRIS